jgi:DHA1 family 2-module integral membrane pump EmrD-like MFS transporter
MQGIAAAGPSALSKAVLNDTFTGKEHTQVFSYLALCWGLSIVSAPFIGSYLQEYVNWQACFYALTLIGSLMFIVVFFLLPETLPPEERHHINFIGFWKRCAKVLANPIFLCCAIMNSIFYLFILIFSILGPFLIQDYWHYSTLFYGRMALLMGVAWVAGTYSARMLVMHFTSGAILLGSVVALAVTTIANYYIAITWQNNIYSLIIPMLLAIYFSGIAFPGRMSCGMSLFPRNLGGTASSMLGVVTFLFAGAASSAISHIHPTTQIPWAEVMLAFAAILVILTAIFFALRKRYCPQATT